MKKKILQYCLFGAPAGVTVNVLFTLWGSWLRGDGGYHFTTGHMVQVYGSELNAVAATCVGAMVIGMIWAAASLIYLDTDWSLLKQTVVHCAVCVVPSLLIAYAMHWMPRNWDGLIQYAVVFGVMYALNWTVQYAGMKKRVRRMNEKLRKLEER